MSLPEAGRNELPPFRPPHHSKSTGLPHRTPPSARGSGSQPDRRNERHLRNVPADCCRSGTRVFNGEISLNVFHPGPSISQFIDEDSAYLNWLEESAGGFVVNSERIPKPGYLKLHRTTCGFISSPRFAKWTSAHYIKTCSPNLDALRRWASELGGGMLDPCNSCKPEELPV